MVVDRPALKEALFDTTLATPLNFMLNYIFLALFLSWGWDALKITIGMTTMFFVVAVIRKYYVRQWFKSKTGVEMNMKGFVNKAKKGVVTVEFTKVDTGEKRVMPCTLNRELSHHNVPEILEQREESEHFVVWSMDKEAWRSFRVNTVTNWYEGYPNA